MLSILINAYACSPNMGSEPGMAWNWCVNLAKYCELHIITEGEFKDNIEKTLPSLPEGKNMHFYYNPVSDEIRRMCWNQGDWRFYKFYKEWQWKTYLMAKDICKNTHIDILHQLNMIGFREPGYLWKIKDIPFIWGPVDAKESFPTNYLDGANLKTKLFVRLKNLITKLQLKYSIRTHKAAQSAKYVISASSNSQISFKKYYKLNTELLNETGCNIIKIDVINKTNKTIFDVLWVGKLDFRKQLGLALRIIAEANNKRIRFHIVGGGNNTAYISLANKLGIEKQCIWHGSISHNEVQKIMQDSDVFLFTSVAEGTPHVVLEAISNNLPVICFDTCGQGDSVNSKIGVKIKLSNPDLSIKEFSKIINYLESDRTILHEMAINCKERQTELSWNEKTKAMIELYNKALYNERT